MQATNKTTVTKGTCGACFRQLVLTPDGTLIRHGWREAGGRKTGAYGNVHHVGACFGVGWAPFEVSADCTKAFVEQRLYPMGCAALDWIARLDTRPALYFDGRTWAANFDNCRGERHAWRRDPGSNGWDGNLLWTVRVLDGAASFKFEAHAEDIGGTRVPSYTELHAVKLTEAHAQWDAICHDALYCLDKIATWKPAKVAVEKKALPLVHLAGRFDRARCRMSVRTFNRDTSKVTCPKCLSYVATAPATGV